MTNIVRRKYIPGCLEVPVASENSSLWVFRRLHQDGNTHGVKRD